MEKRRNKQKSFCAADAVARRSNFLLQRPSRRSVEKARTSILNLEKRTYDCRRRQPEARLPLQMHDAGLDPREEAAGMKWTIDYQATIVVIIIKKNNRRE